MVALSQPNPRTFSVSETETGAFLNSVRDYINAMIQPPRFKGSITTATAVTTATNINYPTVEDNYSGWNSTNHNWVVPPTWGGLYLCFTQFKWGSSALPSTPPSLVVNGGAAGTTALLHSANAASIGGFEGIAAAGFVRANAGDLLAVQLLASGFTTANDSPADNNYFELIWASL
jgi:hypothetical protein